LTRVFHIRISEIHPQITQITQIKEGRGKRQVLLNLVMNGIEAMSGIDGRKPCLRLKTDRYETGVLATVSDCGVGFDSAQAEQLFKPFHTTKSGGMGMGLAISRSIIEAHGGKLWAEPNRDAGASFKFTLPAAASKAS
jgi:C4-dicarboxylate-specific signal transduction histidine kinase